MMSSSAAAPHPRQGVWAWLGRTAFSEAAALQEQIRHRVVEDGGPETLLLCEHEPVITLGRHARPEHLLRTRDELTARGVAVCEATRGGDVTYHGPGQLVGYPIFRLRRGVVFHVEAMAAAVVDTLAALGIAAEWRRACPGVWVGNDKICAFGVHVSRRVAVHGFALNVSPDVSAFDDIVPCGLRARGVTSIAKLKGEAPAVDVLASAIAPAFARSFGFALLPVDELASKIANSKSAPIE